MYQTIYSVGKVFQFSHLWLHLQKLVTMFSADEEKNLRLGFWKKLDYLSRRLPNQQGRVKKWKGARTGVNGLDLRFDVSRGKVYVAIEINKKSSERRIYLFEKLNACRSIIEEAYGAPLIWDSAFIKDNDIPVCRIYEVIDGDILDEEKWDAMHEFMLDRMVKLELAYGEVQDFMHHEAFVG